MDCGRDQAFLLPPDFRDWILEDDLAHFVIEAVERVDMGAFKVNHRGTGFSLRCLDKVAGEWHLVALAYNCKRLHKLKLATAS